MRCLSCNKALSDYESTRRYANNPNTFVDLCDNCFVDVRDVVPTITREDLDDGQEDTV